MSRLHRSVVVTSLPAGPVTNRLRRTVVAGSGTLIVAFALLTGQPSAVALGLGIAIPLLILGLLLAPGATQSRSKVAIGGGCHNAAAHLLKRPENLASSQAATHLPAQLPASGQATAK